MPGLVYIQTTGNAGFSGSRDSNSAFLSGTLASVATGVITVDPGTDLSGVNVSGPNQDSIYLADATNSGFKRFWITAVNNTTKVITPHVAPTGTITASVWAIGGRVLMSGYTGGEGFLRPGDKVQINDTPASVAGTAITLRVAGDSTGYIRHYGKAGVRPVITTTDNSAASITGNVAYQWIENLEIQNTGTSGHAINMSGSAADYLVAFNVKISDAGGNGINIASGAFNARIVGCEISGVSGDAIGASDVSLYVLFCNIHDCTGNGISFDVSGDEDVLVAFTIIDSCGGRGILKTSGQRKFIFLLNITIYHCDNSGLELQHATFLTMFNAILLDNGNASGEYNVEGINDTLDIFALTGYNDISVAGSRGGANATNYTLAGTDITGDPLFTDGPNRDFSLGTGSPAINTGALAVPGLFT